MKRTRRTAILPIALLVWTGVAGAKVHVRAHAAKGSRPSATTSAAVAADCNCCCFSQLAFTTGLPDIGATGCSDASGTISGTVVDDGGATLCNLKLGGLYFGGAGVGVPLPLVIPDQGSSITKITSCDAVTGDFILAATTDTDVGGSNPNRSCTAAGVNNPEYPGKPGCLFGAPIPIPNTNSPATSTCVVNRVSVDASGTGNCGDGSSAINVPLLSDIYLTGPTDGLVPCPRCAGPSGSETCQAGPNAGQPCTPADSASLGSAFPTSHDCPPASAAFIGSLPIAFALSSGAPSATSTDLSAQPFVFCGFCGQQFTPSFETPPHPCTADSQCTNGTFPRCRQRNSGAFGQGPARTITENGSPAGVCIGDGATHAATLVSVFCIPASGNGTVDSAGDLPGPGAVALPGGSQLLAPIAGCTTSTTIGGGTTTSTSIGGGTTTSTSLASSTTSTAVATTTSTSLLPLPTCASATFPACVGQCAGTALCLPVGSACVCQGLP